MGSFTYSKPIRACHVDKKLLIDIEEYISAQLSNLGVSQEDIDEKLELTLADSFGDEKIGSIATYPLNLFHSSTSDVKISFSDFENVSFKLYFDESKPLLYLEITGPNARDKVLQTVTGILRILEQAYQSKVRHPFRANIAPMWWIIAFFLLLIGLINLYLDPTPAWNVWIMLLGIVLILYAVGSTIISPYFTFESNSYMKRKRFSEKYFGAVIIFVVVTSVLTYFRKQLLGW